jgi:8-oxo-dGTP pyrophosphatase MutT (NUDIX family)
MIGMKKFRKYIFAVAFIKDKKLKFLIFHRIKNWRGWEFLKGGLKENENETKCLKREIAEETGARKYRIFAKTKHLVKYKWMKKYVKDNHRFQGAEGRLYIIQLFNKRIKIDKSEHDKFKWVDEKDALRRLTHTEQRNALKYVLRNHKLS